MKAMLVFVAFLLNLPVSADDDTPVLLTDMPFKSAALQPIDGSTPWQPPDYAKQELALGDQDGKAFEVPRGMEGRVAFWKDIYTKYTTDQGVFHDSFYTHIVYENVDFSQIMKNSSLSLKQKERERHKMVEQTRKNIRERLARLQTVTSAADLKGDDLRYWHMFEKVDGAKKFADAAVDGRLRFQLGQKDRFIQGIYQSGRYLSQMEQIFREEGIPIELTRLPFVESSFNLKARSRLGASGIWQFMRSSARSYLHINAAVDERNDPLSATRAAAKKLRFNYRLLESWPLAVTAYNRGPSGVKRLVDHYRTKNIVELLDVRDGRFGFASASFYASFLAALQVEQNSLKYFGIVYRMPEMTGTEIIVRKPLAAKVLIDLFDENLEAAKDLNPHILERAWKGKVILPPKSFVRIPLEKFDQALATLFVPVSQKRVARSIQKKSKTF